VESIFSILSKAWLRTERSETRSP
ncbi:uncharacterized protein METZ01_LOCUS440915, partial [marine metagenome]